MRSSAAACNFLALGADKPLSADAIAATIGPEPAKPRAPSQPSLVPLEKDILKACLQALRLHPRVAFVGRFNRGVMQSSYNGRDSYTQFNTVPGFPDIHGMLRGGAAFYIECKRPKVGRIDDKQSNFLAIIRANGGIAGVATSVDEALAIVGSFQEGI